MRRVSRVERDMCAGAGLGVTLAEVVEEGARRFDEKPLHRASIEARSELERDQKIVLDALESRKDQLVTVEVIPSKGMTREEYDAAKATLDPVNPAHYRGDDVMQVIERYGLGFCLGNVVKYVLREREKNGLEDLKKARWYLDREIAARQSGGAK